jgi:hypothetical protein
MLEPFTTLVGQLRASRAQKTNTEVAGSGWGSGTDLGTFHDTEARFPPSLVPGGISPWSYPPGESAHQYTQRETEASFLNPHLHKLKLNPTLLRCSSVLASAPLLPSPSPSTSPGFLKSNRHNFSLWKLNWWPWEVRAASKRNSLLCWGDIGFHENECSETNYQLWKNNSSHFFLVGRRIKCLALKRTSRGWPICHEKRC